MSGKTTNQELASWLKGKFTFVDFHSEGNTLN